MPTRSSVPIAGGVILAAMFASREARSRSPSTRKTWAVGLAVLALIGASNIGCLRPNKQASEPPNPATLAGETLWLTGENLRLKLKIYKSEKLSGRPVLVIVLHGDSPFHPPSYQYEFARDAAARFDNLMVAAVLRPGYADGTGDRSEGVRGLTTGDNYTPQVIDAIQQVIEQLKRKYKPSAVVLVGHSGGSAISADLIGRWPSLANGALLVSCVCDVTAWRKHMAEKQFNPIWFAPVKSLSPTDLVDQISPSVHVRMLVGSKDDVAPPELTQKYAAALRARGIDVQVTVVQGLPHEILLEPASYDQLKALVKSVEKDAAS
jgi:predicted esterase